MTRDARVSGVDEHRAVERVRCDQRAPAVQRWYRIPWPLRVAVLSVLWLGCGALLLGLQAPQPDHRTVGLITRACQVGVAVSIVVDIFLPVVFGSVDDLAEYSRSLRAGTLPAGVDHRQWRRRLVGSRLALTGVSLFGCALLGLGIFSTGDSRRPYDHAALGLFVLLGLGLFALMVRRIARTQRLGAVLSQDFQQSVGADPKQRWVFYAAWALPSRVAAIIFPACLVAFPPVFIAHVLLHGLSGISDLKWVAAGSVGVGLVVTGLRMEDPRLRATPETLSRIVEYDRAYMTGELPQQFDVDQWRRWLKGQRRSDNAELVWAAPCGTIGFTLILGHQSGLRWAGALLFGLLAGLLMIAWRGSRLLRRRLAHLIQNQDLRQRYG